MTEAVVRHVRPVPGSTGTRIHATPAGVGWRYLSFRVVALGPGETMDAALPGEELVVVPLAGSGRFRFGGADHPVGPLGAVRLTQHGGTSSTATRSETPG